MYQEQIEAIQTALKNNPECPQNAPDNFSAIYIHKGRSGEKELLVPIFFHRTRGYWYGYIQKATKGLSGYFAVLVWLTKPVTGKNDRDRAESFHNLAWKEGLFEPPTIQNKHDAFAHTQTFSDALNALAHIIGRFEIEKRFPQEDSPFYQDPIDCSILMHLTDIEDLILL